MNYVKLAAVENYLSIDPQEQTNIEERIYQGMRSLGIAPILEHTAVVLEVDNYKAALPRDIEKIRFVSYMQSAPSFEDFQSLCPDCTISDDDTNTVVCTGCEGGTALLARSPVGLLERQVCRIRHQGIVYLYDYYAFVTSNYYQNHFELLMPRRTPFTNKAICAECTPACSTCSETYEILSSNEILTSFEKGTVCIDYFKYAIDDDGDFLIPDNPSILSTIAAFVEWKHWEERMNKKEQGAYTIMKDYRDRYVKLKGKLIGEIVLSEYDPVAINQILYKDVKEARSPKNFNYNYKYYSTI